MPVTVFKQLGTMTVRFTFDTDPEARQFADPALCALRDAQVRLTHARKQTAEAYYAFTQQGAAGLSAEFTRIMQLYFRLPPPTDDAGTFAYKEALARIQECLSVVGDAFPSDGMEIGQLDEGMCSGGTKGLVPNTFAEGVASKLFTSDAHAFVGVTPLEGNILVNYELLQSSYWVAVNTLVHEATHKFARTWDHAYFGAGGAQINADITWFGNCKTQIYANDPTDDYFATTPQRNWDRGAALERLARAMRRSNEQERADKKLSLPELGTKFTAIVRTLNKQAAAAGQTDFLTDKVKALTPKKALNNADSYSCYVLEMPASSRA
jgi:hypothetical protein